jgi:hypothetical protein
MTSPHPPGTPTSTGEMLRRTRRRADQIRRRRRAAVTTMAAAVVAAVIAVPLVVADNGHDSRVVQVQGGPEPVTSPTTAAPPPPTSPAATVPSATVPSATVPSATVPSATVPSATVPSASGPTTASTLCAAGQLRARITDPSGAAGSVGYNLLLVNIGSHPCSLGGYPGVSYVTGADGTTVGTPAQRTVPGPLRSITIVPGRSATATLIEVDSLNFPGSCRLTTVAGLRIYPPNQTVALFVPQSTRACANPADPVLRIGPVEPSPATNG